MVVLHVPRNTRKLTRKDIDLDALICLDMSHQWRLVEDNRVAAGVFVGTPERVKLCMVCGSLKSEVVAWNGRVLSRTYRPDPVYLTNARKLADNVNERRMVYRSIILGRPPRDVCPKCFIVHESADCPIEVS